MSQTNESSPREVARVASSIIALVRHAIDQPDRTVRLGFLMSVTILGVVVVKLLP
jgi:hypothetical protein